MFYRLDLLVAPHPKSLGLDATVWTPDAQERRAERPLANLVRPVRRQSARRSGARD